MEGSRIVRGLREAGTAVKDALSLAGSKAKGWLGRGEKAFDAEGAARSMSGPVEFRVFADATPEQVAQFRVYVDAANDARSAGALSSTGRVSTNGDLARQATRAAEKERIRALRAGTPYKGVVGHGPDTTWTGNPIAYRWLDLDSRVNSSLAGQVNRYPVGFKPTEFRLLGL